MFNSILLFMSYNVWYHGGYVRVTVTHRDFIEATECSFWKITVDHRDSGIFTVIPNIVIKKHHLIIRVRLLTFINEINNDICLDFG
jgi:hypothetical protein